MFDFFGKKNQQQQHHIQLLIGFFLIKNSFRIIAFTIHINRKK